MARCIITRDQSHSPLISYREAHPKIPALIHYVVADPVVSDAHTLPPAASFRCFLWVPATKALKSSGLGAGEGEAVVEVVVVNHPSPASPSGIKWEKAKCLNELVLNSSKCKEVDRFLL